MLLFYKFGIPAKVYVVDEGNLFMERREPCIPNLDMQFIVKQE